MAATAQQGDSRLAVTGAITASRDAYQVHGNLLNLDLEHWSNYLVLSAPVVERGQGDLDVAVWGGLVPSTALTLPDLLVHGTLRGGACQILGVRAPLQGLTGQVTATSNWIHLEGVHGHLGPAALSLDGRIADFGRPRG